MPRTLVRKSSTDETSRKGSDQRGMKSVIQSMKGKRRSLVYFRECGVFVLTRRKIATLVFVDSLLLIAANIAAAKFMKPFVAIPMDLILISIGFVDWFYLFYGSLFKVFTRINRYTNLRNHCGFGSLSASAVSSIIILLFINRRYSLRLVILLTCFRYY